MFSLPDMAVYFDCILLLCSISPLSHSFMCVCLCYLSPEMAIRILRCSHWTPPKAPRLSADYRSRLSLFIGNGTQQSIAEEKRDQS